MNAMTQMYDPKYVAARLAARRVQAGQRKQQPMSKRTDITQDELRALGELIAGDADDEMLAAFGQRHNLHTNTLRASIRDIRRQLDTAAAVDPAVEEPAARAVQSPPAVVVAPPPPCRPRPRRMG